MSSADGPERGRETKSREADLFQVRDEGKPRVANSRSVTDPGFETGGVGNCTARFSKYPPHFSPAFRAQTAFLAVEPVPGAPGPTFKC